MSSLGDRITAPPAETTDESIDWAADTQVDGATEYAGGSTMAEPEFDVEVKLIDANSPLYSIKTFEELGLYGTL